MYTTKSLNKLLTLITFFFVFGNLYSQNCPSGLVSYWKMNETSGTTLIDAQAGHNAIRNSSAGTISGKVENSQRFTYTVNGSNNAYSYLEYASVPHNSAFNFGANSSFTISYWVKFRDCGYGFQDHIAISKGDWGNGGGLNDGMWASGLNGSCKINFLLRDNTGYKIDLEGNASFDTETWHHVACVRDEASERNILYVDGVITDQVTYNYSGSFSNSMNLEFSNLVNGGNHGYILRGDLDEVAIFNVALSSSQINNIISSANSGAGICSGSSSNVPVIISSPVTTGTVGNAYSYDVNASGSQTGMTYSLITSPAGMTINASTGVISWNPLNPGNYNVSVQATNNYGSDTDSWIILVSETNSGLCINESFTSLTGTITDNSGAGNYFNSMNCQKLIQPVNATNISLTFTQFNTESGYDFVRIYGGSTTSAPLLGQFSGNSLPAVITSTGGSMLLSFITDNSVVGPGWSATYVSNTNNSVVCINETFNSPTGAITDNSGAGNYSNNMDCQKLIQPANAANVTLAFTQFNTETGYDFVRVYNGSTTSAPLLGQFSGTNLPPTLTSTGGSMLIRFTSDGSIVAPGWSATYTGNTQNTGTCINENFANLSGTITDNSGAGNYFDNMNCQKLIQPANASNVTLTFTQFSTEAGYDFVRVYNGSTTSAPLLGQFSGTSLPPTLTSTGGSMLISFITDYSVTAPGWSATYTGNTQNTGTCINENFASLSGTITDNSGSGNYFNNMNCQKLIQPANAAAITLTFSQFNTEVGYDFVRVYNGSTTSAPLLGQYSGTNLPPSLTSTGGSMLISFITDYSVVAQGWTAQYVTAQNSQSIASLQELTSLEAPASIDNMQIIVYPNPVSEILTIESNILEEQAFTLELINSSGQIVLDQKATSIEGKYELDVSHVFPGLYVLKVTTVNNAEIIRVVKL